MCTGRVEDGGQKTSNCGDSREAWRHGVDDLPQGREAVEVSGHDEQDAEEEPQPAGRWEVGKVNVGWLCRDAWLIGT